MPLFLYTFCILTKGVDPGGLRGDMSPPSSEKHEVVPLIQMISK